MSLLAKRYATALFEAAEQKGATDAVASDLARVAQVLRDPQVCAQLLDPRTQRGERRAALERIVGGGHELSRNLIGVLVRRRREAILPELDEMFTKLVHDSRGEVEGTVETAKPIDDDELRKIEAAASATFGKKVSLRVEVDPELIGGIRLRVGNTLFDGSVATALDDLERKLMEAPV